MVPVRKLQSTIVVYNLFREPVKQPHLGFRKAEEKTRQFEKPDSLKKQY